MKERPILFSGPMVRAILDGRKTQTRRVMMPQPVKMRAAKDDTEWWLVDFEDEKKCYGWQDGEPPFWTHCPYGVPGDRLWVRETWVPVAWGSYEALEKHVRIGPSYGYIPCIQFAADKGNGYHQPYGSYEGKWRPSIFMPRWASRIRLEITDVRVQRVKDISGPDGEAEGIELPKTMSRLDREADGREGFAFRYCFRELWDSINAKRGFGWDQNPWVWALTFRRIAQ